MKKEYTLRDMKLAYIAGIIDGEGYIGLKDRISCVSLVVQATNTDKALLQFIVDTFGGSIGEYAPQANRKAAYKWSLCASKAADMLCELLPYLITKKERAHIALKAASAPLTRAREFAKEMEKLNQRGKKE